MNITRDIFNSMVSQKFFKKWPFFGVLTIILITLLSSNSFSVVYTDFADPIDAGVGAKVPGMGRAYVAAANDVNSIFYNPAGLSFVKNNEYMLGTTSVIHDTVNNSFGMVFAGKDDAIGIGIAGYNIWTPLTAAGSREPASGRTITIECTPVNFNSYVALLSYGTKIGKYINLPLLDSTSFGISIKGFSQNINATEEIFSANGFDIDVGLIYTANSWLRFGLYGQNVLLKSSGGKLAWLKEGGHDEQLPAVYKAGLSTKILGSGGMLASNQTIFLNFDAEQDNIYKNMPVIYHTGLEWLPQNYVALRFGADETLLMPNSKKEFKKETNYTGGIGLLFGDFSFDYAYHRYGKVIDDTLQYFSISYGFPLVEKETPPVEEVVIVKEEPTKEVLMATPEVSTEEYLSIKSPLDMSTTFGDFVQLSCEVISDKIVVLEINNEPMDVSGEAQKHIQKQISVPATGKYRIVIKCLGENANILKEYNIRLVRLPVFEDVPENHWARERIGFMALLNLIGGYPDGKFKPGRPITRAELSSIIAKASGFTTPEVADAGFRDVASNNWAAFFIKTGVDQGYISGYPDGTFRPKSNVSRPEGVAIITRFAKLELPLTIEVQPFDDVPMDHWAAKTITAAKHDGLLGYLGNKPFGIKKNLTRAEAAVILAQTEFIKEKILELYRQE